MNMRPGQKHKKSTYNITTAEWVTAQVYFLWISEDKKGNYIHKTAVFVLNIPFTNGLWAWPLNMQCVVQSEVRKLCIHPNWFICSVTVHPCGLYVRLNDWLNCCYLFIHCVVGCYQRSVEQSTLIFRRKFTTFQNKSSVIQLCIKHCSIKTNLMFVMKFIIMIWGRFGPADSDLCSLSEDVEEAFVKHVFIQS